MLFYYLQQFSFPNSYTLVSGVPASGADTSNIDLPSFNHKLLDASADKMKFITILFAGIAAVVAVDITRDHDLVMQIGQATTKLDVMKLLDKERQWTYDFRSDCDKYSFEPGSVCNANRATFPATTGNGMTMAMLNLGPCSMLPPHFHARASNYVVSISGTTVTYMIAENGASVISSQLTHGKMTIFPQGSIHTMVNTGEKSKQFLPFVLEELF